MVKAIELGTLIVQQTQPYFMGDIRFGNKRKNRLLSPRFTWKGLGSNKILNPEIILRYIWASGCAFFAIEGSQHDIHCIINCVPKSALTSP